VSVLCIKALAVISVPVLIDFLDVTRERFVLYFFEGGEEVVENVRRLLAPLVKTVDYVMDMVVELVDLSFVLLVDGDRKLMQLSLKHLDLGLRINSALSVDSLEE
jgi:hypothetical protein